MTNTLNLGRYWNDSLHELTQEFLTRKRFEATVEHDYGKNLDTLWLQDVRFRPSGFHPVRGNEYLSYEHSFVVEAPLTGGRKKGETLEFSTMVMKHDYCDHGGVLCLRNVEDWFSDYETVIPAITEVTFHLHDELLVARFGHHCANCPRGADFPDAYNAQGHWMLNK